MKTVRISDRHQGRKVISKDNTRIQRGLLRSHSSTLDRSVIPINYLVTR